MTSIAQTRSTTEARIEAANQFKSQYGDAWRIRWDDRTHTPASLVGGKAAGYTGPPEEATYRFLREHSELFGIVDIGRDLHVVRQNVSERNSQISYGQLYKGIPVLYSGYLVAVNERGDIYYVNGDYFPDIKLNITPALDKQDAVAAIQSDLETSALHILQAPRLAVYVNRAGESLSYHLAYQAKVKRAAPLEAYEFLIDAQNGGVLRKASLVKDAVEGTGNVYATNPLHGSPITVTLHRLRDISPRKLDGEHIVVNDNFGDDAESSTATFEYSDTDHRFDQVMVYSHSDEFEEWLLSMDAGLGIIGDGQVGKVAAETRSSTCYACTIPSQLEAFYSDGSAYSGLRNPTREAAVIAHEYMHIVSETYNSLTQSDSANAMDEGYSDYFGIGYRDYVGGVAATVILEYADEAGGTNYMRDVDNTVQLSEFGTDIDGSGNVSPHDGGMILSGALWDFYSSVASPFDALQVSLESLKYLGSNPGFYDARDAAITACGSTATEEYVPYVEDAFAAHGIGSASGASKRSLAGGTDATPQNFRLHQNYPNPFNPSTRIRFELPEAGFVSLSVYDALGREVRRLSEGLREAGFHDATFDATGLPTGVYIVRLDAGSITRTRQIVLMR